MCRYKATQAENIFRSKGLEFMAALPAWSELLLRAARNNTHFAAAFDEGHFCLGHMLHIAMETQLFEQILFGDMIALCNGFNEASILNQQFGVSFGQAVKDAEAIRERSEQTVEKNDDETSAQSWEESHRAVHGSRKHRSQNETENGVQCRHFTQKTLVGDANHRQRSDEDNDAAQADLQEA